jgi:hypothetical protein
VLLRQDATPCSASIGARTPFALRVMAWCVLLPPVVLLARSVVSMPVEVDVTDDVAIIELYTRSAVSGEQLLGPYSRFGFHHPGPMMFYLLVPFYLLSGKAFAGLAVGALTLNLFWLAMIFYALGVTHKGLQRWLALTAVGSFVLFIGPQMLMSAWNPDCAVLPFAFVLVGLAAVQAGDTALLVPMVIAASLAAQSHLSFALPATIAMLVALVATALELRRAAQTPASRISGVRRHLGLAVAVGVIAWLPTIIELVTNRADNLVEILKFAGEKGDGQAWMPTLASTATQFSAFWLGVFGARATTQASATIVAACCAICVLEVFLLAGVVHRGFKHRDWSLLGPSIVGLVLLASGIATTHAIRGLLLPYLNHWLAAVGLASAVTISRAVAVQRQPASRLSVWTSLATPAVAAVIVATAAWDAISWPVGASLGGAWASGLPRTVLNLLRTHDVHSPHLRILRNDEWPKAAGIYLACVKAGLQPSVARNWQVMFGEEAARPRLGDGVLLVTNSESAEELARVPGLATIASEDGTVVLGAKIGQQRVTGLQLGEADAEIYLRSGFSGEEHNDGGSSRWSDGAESTLVLPATPRRRAVLEVTALPVVVGDKRQHLSVEINGTPLRTWAMLPQWDSYSVCLPAYLVREQNLVTFRYSLLIRPHDYGHPGDMRKLAVRFRELTLAEAGAP